MICYLLFVVVKFSIREELIKRTLNRYSPDNNQSLAAAGQESHLEPSEPAIGQLSFLLSLL